MKILRTLGLVVLALVMGSVAKAEEDPYIVGQTYFYVGRFCIHELDAKAILTIVASGEKDAAATSDLNAVLLKAKCWTGQFYITVERHVTSEGEWNLIEAKNDTIGHLFIVTDDPIIDRLHPKT